MKKLATLILAALTIATSAIADHGMWIPMFINKNISEMQKQGLTLSAEDLYSVNQSSLKDAVVIFGGGCTGELVSDEGLLLTNYHCGYDAIQKLSTVEHDYLTNGYWAKSREEELPCEGLSVQFLVDITDVTDEVLANTDTISDIVARAKQIRSNSEKIRENKLKEDRRISVEVESFYGGNQYLLFRYKVYTDIRLVGAPPAEIGKFGGDTDNWVWPRHTGDFSMFRVYADKNNEPADLASSNVPFKPKRHLKISTEGVKEGDFTMVMGYPGSTILYSTSHYVNVINNLYPKKIELRTAKLDVMNKYQAKSAKVNIQYAAKNASTSNAWKKWQGELKGLKKVNAYSLKSNAEADLANKNKDAKVLLDQYASIYNDEYIQRELTEAYIVEAFWSNGVEICSFASRINRSSSNDISTLVNGFYRDYDRTVSEEMAIEVMKIYCKNIARELWPASLRNWKGDAASYVKKLYAKSKLANPEYAKKLATMTSEQALKVLKKDPALILSREFDDLRFAINSGKFFANVPSTSTVNDLNRRYIKTVLEAYPDSLLPSDANFTLRISYGHVAGYEGDDAVEYGAFTTLDGIIEKNRTGNPDFTVPQRLIDLYEQKAYTDYADATDGKLHTAFVATNHTTGGNSGSPVLNAKGELIGLNFDRAWNGVMSDVIFNPLQCRNITLDIRYLLFIVDKYAGARYLVGEMTR